MQKPHSNATSCAQILGSVIRIGVPATSNVALIAPARRMWMLWSPIVPCQRPGTPRFVVVGWSHVLVVPLVCQMGRLDIIVQSIMEMFKQIAVSRSQTVSATAVRLRWRGRHIRGSGGRMASCGAESNNGRPRDVSSRPGKGDFTPSSPFFFITRFKFAEPSMLSE